MVPATTVVCPSVLVIDRFPTGSTTVVSVALSFPGTGSVVPVGTAIDAVFEIVPSSAETVALTRYVTLVPEARSIDSLIGPLPDAAPQADPGTDVQVHVTAVRPAGMASANDAPTTSDGPLLSTTIVYVTEPPDDTFVTPSVFVTPRSATGDTTVVSVAVLSAPSASAVPTAGATVAVLEIVPVEEPATVAATVNVTEPPGVRSTVAVMSPEPDATSQVPPAASVQVHVAPASEAGIVSVTTASVAVDGPEFDTTIV